MKKRSVFKFSKCTNTSIKKLEKWQRKRRTRKKEEKIIFDEKAIDDVVFGKHKGYLELEKIKKEQEKGLRKVRLAPTETIA